MPWQNNNGGGGGPWGGGGNNGGGNNQNPWGNRGNGGNGGNNQQPPDVEELVRQGQEQIKKIIPGGGGGAKGILLIGAAAAALWFATGFYRVQPGQVGVELVFGKLWEETAPGLQYNFPAPIGQVITPEVEQARRTDIGARSNSDLSNRSGLSQRSVPNESLMLTSDENIVDVSFSVFWKVQASGVTDFLFNVRDPENTVRRAAESAIREVVGQTTFDLAVTTGLEQIEENTRQNMQAILDSYGAGIEVEGIKIQQSAPPAEVVDAFNDVQRARQDQERLQNEADAYANSIVPEARGQAEQMVRDAEAYKERQIKEAEGEAERFISVYNEYAKAPELTRQRMYLETMGSILQGSEKVILDQNGSGQGVQPYLPLPELRKRSQASN